MANMAQAIRMALHYAETNMELEEIFGQDTGPPLGGVFTATQGLKTTWNTPLDERGIIGTAMGLALAGKRCVAEIQFADYIFNSIDLLKQAGMVHWSSRGRFRLPLVVMTPHGAGIHGAIYHSHSFDSWAVKLAGWKVVCPSTPLDAYGLMLSAVEDENPVLYLQPKALLRIKGKEKIPGEPENENQLKAMIDAPLGRRNTWKAKWPPLKKYTVPIGKGKIISEGADLSLISFGRGLSLCAQAVESLRKENLSAELIDLRSIYPYDWSLVKKSIQKTKRALFVSEDTEIGNFGEHLACRTARECFYELHSAPRVLAGKQLPGVGLHPHLENETIPTAESIVKEIKEMLSENP